MRRPRRHRGGRPRRSVKPSRARTRATVLVYHRRLAVRGPPPPRAARRCDRPARVAVQVDDAVDGRPRPPPAAQGSRHGRERRPARRRVSGTSLMSIDLNGCDMDRPICGSPCHDMCHCLNGGLSGCVISRTHPQAAPDTGSPTRLSPRRGSLPPAGRSRRRRESSSPNRVGTPRPRAPRPGPGTGRTRLAHCR